VFLCFFDVTFKIINILKLNNNFKFNSNFKNHIIVREDIKKKKTLRLYLAMEWTRLDPNIQKISFKINHNIFTFYIT
jgi:hypothetical protein